MYKIVLEIRKREHISIKKLSQMSGVSVRTISNWEYAGVTPTVDKFSKVLEALGYTLQIMPKEANRNAERILEAILRDGKEAI